MNLFSLNSFSGTILAGSNDFDFNLVGYFLAGKYLLFCEFTCSFALSFNGISLLRSELRGASGVARYHEEDLSWEWFWENYFFNRYDCF
jgi:hypothetical protein